MILQSLYDYYHRKVADDTNSIAPLGFQYKEIPFIIVLEENGAFFHLTDTREPDGKKKKAKSFLVPQEIKRTSGIAANLLWDKPDYLLGYAQAGQPEAKIRKMHEAFVERVRILHASGIDTPGLSAVLAFLEKTHTPEVRQQIEADPIWPEVLATQNSFMSFSLGANVGLICTEPDLQRQLQAYLQPREGAEASDALSRCLISGNREPLALTHPAIKGVPGSQTSGANIVSFNLSAACSYGKSQGENAPVGKSASIAYTSALNLLLARDSRNKVQLAGTTVVFWAERQSELANQVETGLGQLQLGSFGDEADEDSDNPDQGVRLPREGLSSPWTGKPVVEDAENRFFVLGLAPNAARLAIRFFHVLSLEQIKRNMDQHFADLEIVRGPRDQRWLPLRRLIQELCLQHKLENVPPNLEGKLFESIVLGAPYPAAILQTALRRIRAEQAGEYPSVNYPRAALIKAYLNREIRNNEKNSVQSESQKEFTVALDETNMNIGYCLGRLFAILEKIQERASGISTIRERFYGTASCTPSVAFPQLLKLKNHHLAKLDSPGLVIFYEKLISQIMGNIETIPNHLKLMEQGAFSLGYYHQRQAFHTKKDSSETETADLAPKPEAVAAI
jgi:CRISPR-associated protein Csd1